MAATEVELRVGIAPTQAVGVIGTAMQVPAAAFELVVQVVAEGFSSRAGESLRQVLSVTADTPFPVATLHLTAAPQTDPIRLRTIEATYFAGGQPVGVAYRPVAIVARPELMAATAPPTQPKTVGLSLPTDTPPDLTISITEGDDDSLVWSFESPHPITPREPLSKRIGTDSGAFTRALIARMARASPDLLGLEMVGIGREIAKPMPGYVDEILREVATQLDGRPPTVLILARNAEIPWELAFIPDPLPNPDAAPFLGAQAVVGHWGKRLPDEDEPVVPPPVEQPATSMAVLCGRYPPGGGDEARWRPLPQAEAEADELVAHYGAEEIGTTSSAVAGFLKKPPTAEVIHFAGHGIFDTSSEESGLVLSDLSFLTPTVVGGATFGAVRPFVFLNACQAGAATSVLGCSSGLAEAFLRAGACGVVAPIWSVDDTHAHELSRAFYGHALEEGVSPAEILRARRAGFGAVAPGAATPTENPADLAYRFFGHPNLRLVRPRTPNLPV